jgi:hypothetical protein
VPLPQGPPPQGQKVSASALPPLKASCFRRSEEGSATSGVFFIVQYFNLAAY